MKIKTTIALVTLAATSVFATAAMQEDKMMNEKSAYEWLSQSKDHSMFVELIDASDTKDSWNDKAPFTLFAPTNSAFRKIPQSKIDEIKGDPEKLRILLKYHTVNAKHSRIDLASRNSLNVSRRADGKAAMVTIKSDGPWITVNDARIIRTNYWNDQGIIHTVDAVLMPMNW